MLNFVPITDSSSDSTPVLRVGSSQILRIEKLVPGGSGLARVDGHVVFCPDTLPGELVRVEILSGRKGVWYGDAKEIVEPHESRHQPPCPYVGKCGGCQLQHLPYGFQLEQKALMLKEILCRIGKQNSLEVAPVVPSSLDLGYRHVIRLAVAQGKRTKVLGLFEAGGHVICPIEQCLLAVEEITPIVREVEAILGGLSLPRGLLVHVEIRWSGYEEGSQLILRGFAQNASKISPIMNRLEQIPLVRGVVYEWLDPQDRSQRKRSSQDPIVRGHDYLWQSYLGLVLKVGFRSFMQANWLLFEQVGQDLLQGIKCPAGFRMLELYAGVSPLGMVLARIGARVTCVEVNKWAVEDARISVARNGLHGCRVKEASAESYLHTVQPGQFDGMLLDPPRAGLMGQVVDRIVTLGVPRLWYLSCDMATLARDVKRLCEGGYVIQRVQPYDMFPQTAQLETMVTLYRSTASGVETHSI